MFDGLTPLSLPPTSGIPATVTDWEWSMCLQKPLQWEQGSIDDDTAPMNEAEK